MDVYSFYPRTFFPFPFTVQSTGPDCPTYDFYEATTVTKAPYTDTGRADLGLGNLRPQN